MLCCIFSRSVIFCLIINARAHIDNSMNAITHIRKNIFGTTQAKFATALNVNQSTVSRWERGELVPSLNELAAIRALADTKKIKWSDAWFFDPPAEPEKVAV